jgi:hypothetical protein
MVDEVRKYYDALERAILRAGTNETRQRNYLIGHYASTLSMLKYVMRILEDARKSPFEDDMRHEIDRVLSILDTVLIIDTRDGEDHKDSV